MASQCGRKVADSCAIGLTTSPSQVSVPSLCWQVEEDEEELQPPARPGSAAAAAASAEKLPDGKPPARLFLPVEEDEDDPGLIPGEEQIRCAAAL